MTTRTEEYTQGPDVWKTNRTIDMVFNVGHVSLVDSLGSQVVDSL
jgi:hypothetical protein